MRLPTALVNAFFLVALAFCVWAFFNVRPNAAPQAPPAVVREVVVRESVFVRDTIRLTRTLTQWDTLWRNDTIVVDSVVYVPRDRVDSIVAACRPVAASCASLVQAVRDSAQAVTRRPWRSAGVTYPWGAYYDQDFGRLRSGVSAGLGPDGRPTGQIRFGIRW